MAEMNRKIQIMMSVIEVIGILILALCSFNRASLNDFTLGFYEGIAVVFILAGIINSCWNAIQRRKARASGYKKQD